MARGIRFNTANVKNPARKILLAEEQSSLRGEEVSDPAVNVINDGRWVPTGDVITSRHNKRGDVGWADGHVTAIPWKAATDR